jgi:ABC-type glycerol-3-phosphate transport system substrate-binding protein
LSEEKVSRRGWIKYAGAGVVVVAAAAGAGYYATQPKPTPTPTPTTPTPKPTTPTPTPTKTPVTLTHWHPAHGDVHAVLDPLISKKYPWITPKGVDLSIGDMYDKLVTSFAAGSGAPDLFANLWRWWPTFVPEHVIDLTDQVKDIKDMFHPFLWEQATYKGKIYGIPLWYCPHAVWYRHDVFEKEGIKPKEIETWDDFIEVGKTLSHDGRYMIVLCNAPYGTNHFLSLLNSREGQLFDEEGKAYKNNTLAAELLEWETDLILKHKIAYYEVYFSSGFWASLKAGKGLSWTMHSGAGPYNMIKSLPEQSGKWRGLPWPLWGKGKPKNTGVWGGGAECITKQCKYVDDALLLLKENFATEDALWQWYTIKKFVSSNPKLLKRQLEGPGLDYCGGQNIYELFQDRKAPPLHYAKSWSQVEAAVGKALDESFMGRKKPKDAWKECEETLIKLLGESKEEAPKGI